jgi:hypothetical protein
MMTQGELSFKYEMDHQGEGMTGMGGIGTYLDLACRSALVRSVERHVKARKGDQGWRLESDQGFCRLLSKGVIHGLSRKG